MPRQVFLVAVLLASTSGSAVRAGDAAVLPGESRTTATRLAEVRKKIDDKKYVEAIDALQAILESAGNDLVPLTPQRCVQARRLCHRELAKLPPEALLEYRARVEPQAKKWLDEAKSTRDRRLLRRVVDEAFCSRAGETAVDLLGDLAFERGCFDEAVAWWSLLAPTLDIKEEGRDEAALVYPDVQGDKARLYAKQIVALFFAGATEKAKHELKAFQKAFPNAEGELTGHKGKYAKLLEDLVKQSPPTDVDKSWTTFGGDATRGLVLAATPRWLESLAFTVKEGPTWRFDLEKRTLLDDTPLPAPGTGESASVRARSLAFHPLICGHYVVVSDAQYVTAYDLRTGKATQWFDVADLNALAVPNLKLPVPLDLRYTLTVADGCLYVRLGAQNVFHPEDIDGNDPDGVKAKIRDEKIASFIACLSLEPASERKRVRWCLRPMVVPGKPEWEQRGAIFEGAPIVHNGLLYAAVTWFEGDRTVTAIQCYPAGTETLPAEAAGNEPMCDNARELKSKEPAAACTSANRRWSERRVLLALRRDRRCRCADRQDRMGGALSEPTANECGRTVLARPDTMRLRGRSIVCGAGRLRPSAVPRSADRRNTLGPRTHRRDALGRRRTGAAHLHNTRRVARGQRRGWRLHGRLVSARITATKYAANGSGFPLRRRGGVAGCVLPRRPCFRATAGGRQQPVGLYLC